MIPIFIFWNISFKVCNNACNMPGFGEKYFHPFYSVFFEMNDTADFEDKVLYICIGYQTRICIQSL